MVEPGLYVNVCPGTRWSNKKAASWHLHAICWGENREQMKKRFCQLNRDDWYLSILHSQREADQKEISDARLPKNRDRSFLADKLRYLLKSPQKAYRIYKTNRVTTDGEIVPCFKQKKSELRKGDRITLFHLFKGLHFPELAAAGGEGTDIMRRIKRRAVRVRCSWRRAILRIGCGNRPRSQRRQGGCRRASSLQSYPDLGLHHGRLTLGARPTSPPVQWPQQRRRDSIEFCAAVVNELRGTSAILETEFDAAKEIALLSVANRAPWFDEVEQLEGAGRMLRSHKVLIEKTFKWAR
jgi:hypothetical protein